MFEAVVSADTLSKTLDPIGVLVDECKIRLDEDGLRISAMDPATVGVVELHLEASAFESYEADSGVVGVDVERLDGVVGMADADQLVHLELDAETRQLLIRIGGLEYTLALVDPNAVRQEPDLDSMELPASAVVEGRQFGRAIRAAEMVSNHVAVGVDESKEQLYIDAEGDVDTVHYELTSEDLVGLRPGPAHSLFSLDYLADMNRVVPGDAAVTLELGEEFPMRLSYEFAEGNGAMLYFLAPRIQSR
ncbi:DNA polymerase sliding clamp [Haloprofundus salinisoli]|uniref:DNA polymerase sliding clamp n=1 Tax=Haloprofundus salinisoli TaxID=2876193 RepID=UPI001CCC47AC|nr:DNA polymerase sliding clamp [Haloprofundus salinisoli]